MLRILIFFISCLFSESVMVEEVNGASSQSIELAHIPDSTDVSHIEDMSGDDMDTSSSAIHENVQV